MSNAVIGERIKETTITQGTGTVTLLGASTGFQTFAAGVGVGAVTFYAISSDDSSEWEVGVGTILSGPARLSRDTVYRSSNSNALVNFSAGTKFVFCPYPATKAVAYEYNSNDLVLSGSLSVPVSGTFGALSASIFKGNGSLLTNITATSASFATTSSFASTAATATTATSVTSASFATTSSFASTLNPIITLGGKTTIGTNGYFVADVTNGIRFNNSADTVNNFIISDSGTGSFRSDMIAGSASNMSWFTRSKIASPSSSVITLFNSSSNNFSLLQFGGTGSAHPAIKRSGTNLHFRTADDAGFTNISVGGLTVSNGGQISNGLQVLTGGLDVTGLMTATSGTFSGPVVASKVTVGSGATILDFDVTLGGGLTLGISQSFNLNGGSITGLKAGSVAQGTFPGLTYNFAGDILVGSVAGVTFVSNSISASAGVSMGGTSVIRGNSKFIIGDADATNWIRRSSNSPNQIEMVSANIGVISCTAGDIIVGAGGLNKVGFNGSIGTPKITVSGSRGSGSVALAQLLNVLATYGLITDSTS
jgi:hypothetical protein